MPPTTVTTLAELPESEAPTRGVSFSEWDNLDAAIFIVNGSEA